MKREPKTWSWAPSPRSPEFIEALNSELDSWEGTPYAQGQRRKGAGVDCVRFACAIMDVIFGEVTVETTLPHDAAFHTKAGALAALRKIIRLYPAAEHYEGLSLEPGDVVVTGPSGGGPGHAMIVGGRRNELWHSCGSCVQKTSVQILDSRDFQVFRVYRMRHG